MFRLWTCVKRPLNMQDCFCSQRLQASGFRLGMSHTTQVFICQAEDRGGEERPCWFVLLHSYGRTSAIKCSMKMPPIKWQALHLEENTYIDDLPQNYHETMRNKCRNVQLGMIFTDTQNTKHLCPDWTQILTETVNYSFAVRANRALIGTVTSNFIVNLIVFHSQRTSTAVN